MKTHNRTIYTIPGTEIEVELPLAPSFIMDFKEPIVRIEDDKIVLGYLADDSDAENPLENDDYAGKIFEARRNGPTLRDYEQALGLGDFEGEPRDPHAVLLDVYEHGGASYSLSGQGMQCRFDTAQAGACWVPGDLAREELLRRAAVYRKGRIYPPSRPNQSWAIQHGVGNASAPFDSWAEAFAYLHNPALPDVYTQVEAERFAAEESATADAKQYTAWRNGDCYTIVVAEFDKDGNEISWDCCGGFIGADDAYQALQDDYFSKEA